MIICAVTELAPFEHRVALTPETTKKFVTLGCDVLVQSGAGVASGYVDAAYAAAGATVIDSRADGVAKADVLITVQDLEALQQLKAGTVAIGLFNTIKNTQLPQVLQQRNITAFSLERIPRITRAQSMDVLSSQANLGGYKAVVLGMNALGRAMPMMMTAAGSIKPAKVVVMGAGVAGLQAIATAKRMGAKVFAFDVRPAVKEQVMSLGGIFIDVPAPQMAAETSGGYAQEMDAAYQQVQQRVIAEALKDADLVITTALIPGKPAPILVTPEVVRTMKPGAVIVDMAVEQGGNCPLSVLGETIDVQGVQIIGAPNLPALLAYDASALYARNLYNFFELLWDAGSRKVMPKWEDTIVISTCIAGAPPLTPASSL